MVLAAGPLNLWDSSTPIKLTVRLGISPAAISTSKTIHLPLRPQNRCVEIPATVSRKPERATNGSEHVAITSLDNSRKEHFKNRIKSVLSSMNVKITTDVTIQNEIREFLACIIRGQNDSLSRGESLRIIRDAEKTKKVVARSQKANVNYVSLLRVKKIRYAHCHREVQLFINITNLFIDHSEVRNVLDLNNESKRISNSLNIN